MYKNIKKNFIKVVLIMTTIVCTQQKIYAQELPYDETKIDELITMYEEQKHIKQKIEKLEAEEENIQKTNNDEDFKVVRLSFVEKENTQPDIDVEQVLDNDITYYKNELNNNTIDIVYLEKVIKQDIDMYLEQQDIDFIKGIWPLAEHTEISSPYGNRIHPITKEYKFHKGVDIPAPKNTEILASDTGVVTFSGVQNGYGNVVKIQHLDGKKTVYAHNESNLVNVGDLVKRGEVIAKVGSTGMSTGDHVHFEILFNDETINPVENIIN